MSGGIRSQGRQYALQVLYAVDLNPAPGAQPDVLWQSFELEMPTESVSFASELVSRVSDALPAVDEMITSVSKNWRLERMSRVDRNILRLATAELMQCGEVPIKVVINEAVELAKRFGAAEAPAFVNGLLDRIAQRSRN